MGEWIYFIHPPREDFAATMTEEERTVWGVHFERFGGPGRRHDRPRRADARGRQHRHVHLRGADEAAARRFMEEDPVIAGGYARGELRPFRVSLLRGRD